MVIKTISRKSDVHGLIKYVLKNDPPQKTNNKELNNLYVPGVTFTKQDLLFLQFETIEKDIDNEIKMKFGGDKQAFIEHQLSQEKVSLLFTQNLRSRSINQMAKEYEHVQQARLHKRQGGNVAEHLIIAFSPEDTAKITKHMIKDIAEHAVKLYGENILAVVSLHENTPSLHIHCVLSSSTLAGVGNRKSIQEYEQFKIGLQTYTQEKFPQLSHSTVRHGLKRQLKEKGVEKIEKRNERTPIRNELIGHVEKIYAASSNKENFLNQLKEANMEVYQRNGETVGLLYEGLKWRFSRLGCDLKELERRGLENTKEEKTLQELRSMRGKHEKQPERVSSSGITKEDHIENKSAEDKALQEIENIRQAHTGNIERSEPETANDKEDKDVAQEKEQDSVTRNETKQTDKEQDLER